MFIAGQSSDKRFFTRIVKPDGSLADEVAHSEQWSHFYDNLLVFNDAPVKPVDNL